MMKHKLLLLGLVLACSSLLFTAELFAQQCKAHLVNGPRGMIIDIFSGSNCVSVRNRCNTKVRQLLNRDPIFYRNAYCDIVGGFRPPVRPPVRPPFVRPPVRPYVTRAYNRCQANGIVRCTQKWSNGRIITEDYTCRGCRGYGNPASAPCAWRCSFPRR
jgi:hypothetical protein